MSIFNSFKKSAAILSAVVMFTAVSAWANAPFVITGSDWNFSATNGVWTSGTGWLGVVR